MPGILAYRNETGSNDNAYRNEFVFDQFVCVCMASYIEFACTSIVIRMKGVLLLARAGLSLTFSRCSIPNILKTDDISSFD